MATKRRSDIFKRRFHLQLSKLRQLCNENGLTLYSNKDNYVCGNFVCVLSLNDCEIGELFSRCDDSYESYYLSPHDYEIYVTLEED